MMNLEEEITNLLHEEDPVNLKSPKKDEYSNEASLFINWNHSKNYKDILNTLYDIFVSQFNYGEDEEGNASYYDVVGDKSCFESSAKRICDLLNKKD